MSKKLERMKRALVRRKKDVEGYNNSLSLAITTKTRKVVEHKLNVAKTDVANLIRNIKAHKGS